MAGTVEIDLSNIAKVTNPDFYPLHGVRKRNLLLMGGAGSGKSHFAAQKIVLRCMRNRHHACCFRKIASTLKKSVWLQIKVVIEQFGVSHLWRENKSDLTLTFVPNGSQISCLGLDDTEKLKSIVGMTMAWIEEATEVTRKAYHQVNLRLRGRTSFYKQIILTFNPINILHWIKKHFVDSKQARETTYIHKSTFLNNEFIDDEYKAEIRAYAEVDPYVWQVYGKGEWGVIGDQIYRMPTIIPDADWPTYFNNRFGGVDFGFNFPTAVLDMGIVEESLRDKLFVNQQIYMTQLTNPMLIEALIDIQYPRDMPTYADAQEISKIEEIRSEGFNFMAAHKGQGSVKHGIELCQTFEICCREKDLDFLNEITAYQWAKNRAEETTDSPIKFNDHAMDAMRYGVFTATRGLVEEMETVEVEDVSYLAVAGDILPDIDDMGYDGYSFGDDL